MPLPFNIVLYRVYQAQRNYLLPHMQKIGLSPGQPKVLRYLVTNGQAIQREIAEHCGIEAATVSRLLSSMEEKGFVLRGASPGCKRSCTVTITEKGKNTYSAWEKICIEYEKKVFSSFSEQEKHTLTSLLAKYYHELTGKELEL